jgi:hypothetical protein
MATQISGTTGVSQVQDGIITTNKILNNAVTTEKIVNDSVITDKILNNTVTNDKLSLAANASEIKKALNADNDPPIFACRAWVKFNGATTPPTILASGNVLSVVRITTGTFTVNFITEMPDSNYSISGLARANSVSSNVFVAWGSGATPALTTSVDIRCFNTAATLINCDIVSLEVFR